MLSIAMILLIEHHDKKRDNDELVKCCVWSQPALRNIRDDDVDDMHGTCRV